MQKQDGTTQCDAIFILYAHPIGCLQFYSSTVCFLLHPHINLKVSAMPIWVKACSPQKNQIFLLPLHP
jgi:hypothetical protein